MIIIIILKNKDQWLLSYRGPRVQEKLTGFESKLPNTEFQALNLPRWLSGRPQRFSGLEIVGRNLEKDIIAETLGECCLSEGAISAYQQQVKKALVMEEELAAWKLPLSLVFMEILRL